MKLPRRTFLHLAAGAAAWAQAYPSRPVRLIVGFPAGGVADLFARLFGQWLSNHLGQQFIIENRAGAGGNIATEAVVRAPPDGYTLLQFTSTNCWNVALYDKLNFDILRDIAPVASTHTGFGVATSPAEFADFVPTYTKTWAKVIRAAKRRSVRRRLDVSSERRCGCATVVLTIGSRVTTRRLIS